MVRIHIVQKGDTLWKIAKKYGVDFEELKSVNTQLSNPDMIMPGMKIKVPQGTKQVKKEMPKKEMPKKEMPKKEMPSMPPYKENVPKPIPIIKEDEKKPVAKGVMEKPMMPMQPINMNMPISMPSIDQQMQNYYTTFHLPQMPMPQAPKAEKEEMPSEESKEDVKAEQYEPQQYIPQQYAPQQYAPQQYAPQQYAPQEQYCPPGQPQLVHSDFYCCPPQPYMMPMQMPMHQQPMPMYPQQMYPQVGGVEYESESSSMMGGMQAGSDCGCEGGQWQDPQAYGPMMGYGQQPFQGYPQQQWPQSYGPMQQPMGGWQPYHGGQPMGNWNTPQSMGNWNQQQPFQGQWYPQPWRDDDLDED
ncbi:hypothetical protein LD39_11745 [Halobacillus sp. BBL2006]|nr:hypothetical protein LD39_11745 [Halobacillus sp. BBL2006]